MPEFLSGDFVVLFTAIATIVLIAGIVHSAIGFGFGIVALGCLTCMPWLMNAEMAHVIMSICSFPMLLTAAWAFRKGIDWPSLVPALLGAAVMMPVGLFAFGSMSLDMLVRGTGLAIFVMTLLGLRNRNTDFSNARPTESRNASFIAGAISGLLGGAVSIAGPPVATFALRQNWSPERFKAFVTQCLLVVCTYKVIGLGIGGWVTRDAMIQAIWATPFAMIGIQIGVVVSRKIDPAKFQWIVAVVLIAVACLLMYRGQP